MTPPATLQPADDIIYPESDGLPMSDNTVQFRWITVLSGNLAARFSARKDVLVGGNLLWYAREGDVNERAAPDVFVVFGRPKGDRGSFKQWVEGGVPMTVVFEIVSPSNGPRELARKLIFYDDYGVEEYYIYDPDEHELTVYLRGRQALVLQPRAKEYVSQRLGIRFDLTGPEMVVYHPDGQRFLTFEELHAVATLARDQRLEAELEAEQARQDADKQRLEAVEARKDADQQRQEAEQARQEAEKARKDADAAQQFADKQRRDAEQARQRVEQAESDALHLLTALTRMRELSRKARRQQATPEELLELERLEEANGGTSP